MRRALPLLILLLAIAGFAFLRATKPAAPTVEARERVWRVEAHALTPTDLAPTLVLYGRIEAPDRVRAASPVGGRLLEVRVRDGDRVEAGTVLARMDPSDLEPRVAQAAAEVERERMFGRLQGMSDLAAYRHVGDAIQARGGFDHLGRQGQSNQPTVGKVVQPKSVQQADALKAKRLAAGASKPVATAPKTVPADFNPLSMSDEEFAKFSPKFV